MQRGISYGLLGDTILVVHVLFVVFVVAGLVLTIVGGVRHWYWVRNPWFRLLHLCAIGVVVVETWVGMVCPLTSLEMALRERTANITYSGTFVAHWLQTLLYYDAPAWVFATGYTLFGLAVVAAWLKFPPRPIFRGR